MLLSSPNAKELVCRVQLVSARGDSPAAQTGTFRNFVAASVCGRSGETARGGEGSFDGWARGGLSSHSRLKRFGGVVLGGLVNRIQHCTAK